MKVKRYSRCYHKDYIPEGMEEHFNGNWVKWEDVSHIMSMRANLVNLTEDGRATPVFQDEALSDLREQVASLKMTINLMNDRWENKLAENDALKKEIERLKSSVTFVSLDEVQKVVDKMGACKHTVHPLTMCLDCWNESGKHNFPNRTSP
jgi:regulator of replication initiation timing